MIPTMYAQACFCSKRQQAISVDSRDRIEDASGLLSATPSTNSSRDTILVGGVNERSVSTNAVGVPEECHQDFIDQLEYHNRDSDLSGPTNPEALVISCTREGHTHQILAPYYDDTINKTLGHFRPMSFVAVYHSSAPNVRDPAEGVEMVGRKELGEFEDDNLRWAPSDVRCVLQGLLVWRGSGEKGVNHQ